MNKTNHVLRFLFQTQTSSSKFLWEYMGCFFRAYCGLLRRHTACFITMKLIKLEDGQKADQILCPQTRDISNNTLWRCFLGLFSLSTYSITEQKIRFDVSQSSLNHKMCLLKKKRSISVRNRGEYQCCETTDSVTSWLKCPRTGRARPPLSIHSTQARRHDNEGRQRAFLGYWVLWKKRQRCVCLCVCEWRCGCTSRRW